MGLLAKKAQEMAAQRLTTKQAYPGQPQTQQNPAWLSHPAMMAIANQWNQVSQQYGSGRMTYQQYARAQAMLAQRQQTLMQSLQGQMLSPGGHAAARGGNPLPLATPPPAQNPNQPNQQQAQQLQQAIQRFNQLQNQLSQYDQHIHQKTQQLREMHENLGLNYGGGSGGAGLLGMGGGGNGFAARKIAASGKIGKPLFVRGRYGHGGRTGYEKEWRCDPRRSGGGELTDQGVHLIDLSQWFLGVPRQAAAFLQTAFWPIRPLEDNGSVLLRYAEGRTSSFQVSWTQWKNLFHFELYGSKGFVEVSGLGGSYGPETLTWGLRKHPGKAPEIRKTVFKGPDSSWAEEWDDFVRAVQSGNTPPNGPKESLSVMRTLDALYRSHRAGKIVSI
jgi:hypothetical protein